MLLKPDVLEVVVHSQSSSEDQEHLLAVYMDGVANCFSTIDLHLKAAVWRKLMTDLLHPH